MECNKFLSRLKADGTETDVVQFEASLEEYGRLAATLRSAERTALAINVLCVLCRNLEKAVGWRERADADSLLRLCAAAAGDARCTSVSERTRHLAALYHLHRYATKQIAPPQLVLKLSSFAFKDEEKNLLVDHGKTYWAILADKLTYIERLKSGQDVKDMVSVLIDDLKKTIYAYDTLLFCTDHLVIIIKKLYHIFSEQASRELNNLYIEIFESLLAKNDLRECAQNLSESAMLDLFRKVNDCLNVIVENSSKSNFENCAFAISVRFCRTVFAHRSDIYLCLNNLYECGYSNIIADTNNASLENVLNNLITSLMSAERLKYEPIAKETYPYLNQMIRTHIECAARDYDKRKWTYTFTVESQIAYLKLIILMMKKLQHSPQILKCVGCGLKSGLHDALRLSFSIRNFIMISLKHGMDIRSILPHVYESLVYQGKIVDHLVRARCVNAEKCRLKAQTDLHNNAILLYRWRIYDYSDRLFEAYIRREIALYLNPNYSEKACLSRAFYNKSICELDMRMFESALRSAFLSLALTDSSELNADKNMSLVIDVKSKALNAKRPEQPAPEGKDAEDDPLQMMSVLEACKTCYVMKEYGDLKPLFCAVDFSALLQHELRRYCRLWPSLQPLVGVWCSLHELLTAAPDWIHADSVDGALEALCEAAAATPCSARTVHHPRLPPLVAELLPRLRSPECKGLQYAIARSTLLFLQAEYDIEEAKNKYGWRRSARNVEMSDDAEGAVGATLRQEHAALRSAWRAGDAWAQLLPRLTSRPLPAECRAAASAALRAAGALAPQLAHYGRGAEAARLARTSAEVAALLDDDAQYVRSVGALLACATRAHPQLEAGVRRAGARLAALLRRDDTRESALLYMCDAAVYHERCGARLLAASLLRYVQLSVLSGERSSATAGRLELARGRLLEAQAGLRGLRGAPGALSAHNAAHRHYMQLANSGGAAWCERRQRGAVAAAALGRAGARCVRVAARALLSRRARAAAAPALRCAAAAAAARLHAALAAADPAADAATAKIDTIKAILDEPPETNLKVAEKDEISSVIQPMKDLQISSTRTDAIEVVLDATILKKIQPGPASPYFDVSAFMMPEFLSHVRTCQCYACENPWHCIISLEVAGILAAAYFRSEEHEIALNYFTGTLKMFGFIDAKLERLFEEYTNKNFEHSVLEIAKDAVDEDLVQIKVRVLMEYAFLLVANAKFEAASKCIDEIKTQIKLLNEEDLHLNQEVLNLTFAFEILRNKVSKPTKLLELGVEKEFEDLKLSPNPTVDFSVPVTPNIKVKLPKNEKPKIVISAEELPHVQRKVIKLNLDEQSPTEEEAVESNSKESKKFFKSKESLFKTPRPKISKAVPEKIIPLRSTRSSKLPVKSQNSFSIAELIEKKSNNKTVMDLKSKTILKKTRSSDIENGCPKSRPDIAGKEMSSSSTDADIPTSKSETANSHSSEEKATELINKSKHVESPDMFEDEVYYTPMKSEAEQFFTPMNTTIKTYAKKSLRHQIAKNLESEFQTSINRSKTVDMTENLEIAKTKSRTSRKTNVEATKSIPEAETSTVDKTTTKTKSVDRGSATSEFKKFAEKTNAKASDQKTVEDDAKKDSDKLRPVVDKRSLRRATSPGRLSQEVVETRKVRPTRTRIQQFRADKIKFSPEVTLKSSIGRSKKTE